MKIVTKKELIEALEDMVGQHCYNLDNELDSMSISSNTKAIKLLAKLGMIEITHSYNKHTLGKWVKVPDYIPDSQELKYLKKRKEKHEK